MIELIKKGVFTGIGLISLTKDKIEELGQEFVEKGKMSEQEGEQFVSELMKRSEESKKEIKKQVEKNFNSLVNKMDLASKGDIASLRKELAEIKAKLEEGEEKA